MPIIDLHCDTISLIHKNKNISLIDNRLQIDINKMVKSDYMLQCFAMFINYKSCINHYDECIKMIDTYYNKLSSSNDIAVALSYDDIINNHNDNKISALLTIEEGAVCSGSIDNLDKLYSLGVRMICLNWNYPNGIGYPNYGRFIDGKPDYVTPNVENGLTNFGFNLIKRMNELGIIIDVSHLSDKGFWDIITTTNKPIVASHSNSRSICKHVRNLSDEMIVALSKKGGVMGMNYYPTFLDDDENIGKNTIECVMRHINHIKALVGVDVIALGSDFDGIDPNIELKDASFLNKLKDRLKLEGFSNEEIEKITYKNALRVFENVLK